MSRSLIWEYWKKIIAENHAIYLAEVEEAGIHYHPEMPDEAQFLRKALAQVVKGLDCRAMDDINNHQENPEFAAYVRWRNTQYAPSAQSPTQNKTESSTPSEDV